MSSKSKFYKKLILFSLCIPSLVDTALANSKSFFMPRSITQDSTFELADTNYNIYHGGTTEHSHFKFYIKPFYQTSTNREDLGKYFLPNNKSCVSLEENGSGDLGSLWFDLISSDNTFYSSKVCLRPARKSYGGVFTLFGDFDNLVRGLWLSINTAVIKVQNSVRLREFNSENPGTIPGFANAYEAFSNPDWEFGKIRNTTVKRAGLDNIEFKLGYNLCRTPKYHFGIYLVTTAPTGNRSHAKNLFEPMVGSNHADIGAGFNADYVFDNCDYKFAFIADLKYRYVFSATEIRSFDLTKNGDWSRYLLVATEQATLNPIPGINIFTLPAKVSPRNTVQIFTAFHYEKSYFNLEIGYNFWWRENERIRLKGSLPTNYGIFDLAGVLNPTTVSASTANISQSVIGDNAAKSDLVFTPLTTNELNLKSAAHPQASSNKIYLTMSVTNDDHSELGIGASYEFAQKHNALSQWAVWMIAGMSF